MIISGVPISPITSITHAPSIIPTAPTLDGATLTPVSAGPGGPQVQVSPERTEVQEGSTVRLYCRVSGSPTATITWEKQGGTLPPQVSCTHGCCGEGCGCTEVPLTPAPCRSPAPSRVTSPRWSSPL